MRASQARDAGVTRSERVLTASIAAVICITLIFWISFKEDAAKYVLYSLPFTWSLLYLIARHGRVKIHRPGVEALMLYAALAMLSMALNRWFDFFAVRDVAIIGGYLFLFTLWFRAPSSAADLALLVLTVNMIVEAAVEGVGEEINLFGSQGILESTLAFSIGAILLYYLHKGRWGRAALAGIVLFLAFKRITFAAVPLALGFDLLMRRYGRCDMAGAAAFCMVFLLSVIALFSTQIFEFVSETMNLYNTSANSISLGRYEIAVKIWAELLQKPWSDWILGSGPGSVDAFVTTKSSLNNPHNDWLKILYDYGVLGFLVIHLILFRTLCEHRLGRMLYIYGAFIMMTDNIFIYMFYHPFVLLMICAARRDQEVAS